MKLREKHEIFLNFVADATLDDVIFLRSVLNRVPDDGFIILARKSTFTFSFKMKGQDDLDCSPRVAAGFWLLTNGWYTKPTPPSGWSDGEFMEIHL